MKVARRGHAFSAGMGISPAGVETLTHRGSGKRDVVMRIAEQRRDNGYNAEPVWDAAGKAACGELSPISELARSLAREGERLDRERQEIGTAGRDGRSTRIARCGALHRSSGASCTGNRGREAEGVGGVTAAGDCRRDHLPERSRGAHRQPRAHVPG